MNDNLHPVLAHVLRGDALPDGYAIVSPIPGRVGPTPADFVVERHLTDGSPGPVPVIVIRPHDIDGERMPGAFVLGPDEALRLAMQLTDAAHALQDAVRYGRRR